MIKPKKIIVASVCSIFIGSILCFAGFLNDGLDSINLNNFLLKLPNTHKNISKSEDLPALKGIQISSSFSTIEIIKSDKFSIDYSYNDEENPPVYSVKDGILFFESNKSLKSSFHLIDLSFNKKEDVIKIYIPDDQILNKVDIDSSFSKILLKEFKSSNLAIKNTHGYTHINDLISDSLTVDTEFGDIELSNCSFNKEVSLKLNHGDISIDNSNLNKLVTELSFGNFESYELVSENTSVTSTHGDITLNNAKTLGLNLSSENSNINVSGNILNNTIIKTVHGDINVRSDQPITDYNYNTQSNHGKTKINNETFEGNSKVLSSAKNTITASSDHGDIALNFKKD